MRQEAFVVGCVALYCAHPHRAGRGLRLTLMNFHESGPLLSNAVWMLSFDCCAAEESGMRGPTRQSRGQSFKGGDRILFLRFLFFFPLQKPKLNRRHERMPLIIRQQLMPRSKQTRRQREGDASAISSLGPLLHLRHGP